MATDAGWLPPDVKECSANGLNEGSMVWDISDDVCGGSVIICDGNGSQLGRFLSEV